MLLANAVSVRRILLVMRGAIDGKALARCWDGLSREGVAIAICYELPAGEDGLLEGLAAQRALTAALRELAGADAEAVAVFAVSDRDGERVADYASAWGATEVGG